MNIGLMQERIKLGDKILGFVMENEGEMMHPEFFEMFKCDLASPDKTYVKCLMHKNGFFNS